MPRCPQPCQPAWTHHRKAPEDGRSHGSCLSTCGASSEKSPQEIPYFPLHLHLADPKHHCCLPAKGELRRAQPAQTRPRVTRLRMCPLPMSFPSGAFTPRTRASCHESSEKPAVRKGSGSRAGGAAGHFSGGDKTIHHTRLAAQRQLGVGVGVTNDEVCTHTRPVPLDRDIGAEQARGQPCSWLGHWQEPGLDTGCLSCDRHENDCTCIVGNNRLAELVPFGQNLVGPRPAPCALLPGIRDAPLRPRSPLSSLWLLTGPEWGPGPTLSPHCS